MSKMDKVKYYWNTGLEFVRKHEDVFVWGGYFLTCFVTGAMLGSWAQKKGAENMGAGIKLMYDMKDLGDGKILMTPRV